MLGLLKQSVLILALTQLPLTTTKAASVTGSVSATIVTPSGVAVITVPNDVVITVSSELKNLIPNIRSEQIIQAVQKELVRFGGFTISGSPNQVISVVVDGISFDAVINSFGSAIFDKKVKRTFMIHYN